MPLERQWERQHTPLRSLTRRERRTVASVALIVVLVGLAATLFAVLDSGSSTAPGCVDVTAATSTGGATIHECGAAAQRFCASEARQSDPLAQAAQASCRRAGYR